MISSWLMSLILICNELSQSLKWSFRSDSHSKPTGASVCEHLREMFPRICNFANQRRFHWESQFETIETNCNRLNWSHLLGHAIHLILLNLQFEPKSRWRKREVVWHERLDKCGWTFVFISFYLWNRRLLLSKSYLCDQFLIGYLSKWILSIWVLS